MKNSNNILLNKKIVITGASGYIGCKLYGNLKKVTSNIIATTRDKNLLKINKDFKKADYQNNKFWSDLIDYADIIFHLSADTALNVSKNELKKNYKTNILPVNLFIQESIKKKKKINFIFTSSASVYGNIKKDIVTERINIYPTSTYDLHKFYNEQNLLKISKNKKFVNCTVLRLSNVYGHSCSESSNKKRGFLNQVLLKALKGNEIKIYGDGKFYRDYIHLDDVVSALKKVSTNYKCKSKIYNVSSGKSYFLIDAVKLIIEEAQKYTNKKSNIKNVPFPDKIDEIEKRNFRISSKKLKKLNWKVNFPLRKGIRDSLIKINFDKIKSL